MQNTGSTTVWDPPPWTGMVKVKFPPWKTRPFAVNEQITDADVEIGPQLTVWVIVLSERSFSSMTRVIVPPCWAPVRLVKLLPAGPKTWQLALLVPCWQLKSTKNVPGWVGWVGDVCELACGLGVSCP